MGSWRRMGAFLGLVPDGEVRDEDYDYEGGGYGYDLDDDRDTSPRYYRRGPSPTGPGPTDGYGDSAVHGSLAMQLQPEPRRTGEAIGGSRPTTVKLTGFSEARIIGERFRDGTSVILDMTELSDADARRVVDFAAGLAFAMRGSIDKVTSRVFMLLPPHADMSAEDRRAFAGDYGGR